MNSNINYILVKQILEICFPVGKVEIFYDNYDHSNYMGFNWQRCLGSRSPYGFDGSKAIGYKFGEATHKLTVDEMPKHKHGIIDTLDRTTVAGMERAIIVGGGQRYTGSDYYPVNYDGKDQAHNNIPPYLAVYMWKKIA